MKSKEKPEFNSSAFDFELRWDVKSAPPAHLFAHRFYWFSRRVMEILLTILVVVAVIWLVAILIRSQGSSQKPIYATRDQLPSIVSKLQRTGRDGSFVVFMFSIPGNYDETHPNLQYSIENGRLGFDWVLLAPQNIKDETQLTDFMKGFGYTVHRLTSTLSICSPLLAAMRRRKI